MPFGIREIAGVASVGAVSTVTFIAVPGLDSMPEVHTLTTAVNGSTSKIGSDYYPFLVDTTKDKKWWEWSFNQLTNDKTSNANFVDPTFKTLTSAYNSATGEGQSNSKALNKYCSYLYKNKSNTDIEQSNSPNILGKNIWKYCSPLGKAPKKVSDVSTESYSNGNIGETKKTEVIAITGNDEFWKRKNQWFKSQSTLSEAYFNDFKTKSLKEACKDAYEKQTNSTAASGKPNDAVVIKACGFKVQSLS